MTRQEIFLGIAYRYLGTPYRWAGSNPQLGFDCSGIVCEGLQSVGAIGRKEDLRAVDLYNRCKKVLELPKKDILPADLLFWMRGKEIGHVEIVYAVVDGMILTIGASGGDSKTLTIEDAIKSNAYIKMRPASPNYIPGRIF
jgi:hypothetical protein